MQGISPTLLYPVPSPGEHPIIALLIKSIRDYYPLWQASISCGGMAQLLTCLLACVSSYRVPLSIFHLSWLPSASGKATTCASGHATSNSVDSRIRKCRRDLWRQLRRYKFLPRLLACQYRRNLRRSCIVCYNLHHISSISLCSLRPFLSQRKRILPYQPGEVGIIGPRDRQTRERVQDRLHWVLRLEWNYVSCSLVHASGTWLVRCSSQEGEGVVSFVMSPSHLSVRLPASVWLWLASITSNPFIPVYTNR